MLLAMFRESVLHKIQFSDLLLVGVGAIPGALIRWQIDNNLIVNLLGAFFLGILFGLKVRCREHLFFGVGFCGSITTFSSWIVYCTRLIMYKNFIDSFIAITLTLVIGLFMALMGFSLGKLLRLTPSR